MAYLYKVLITLMLVASHSVGTEIEGKDGGIKFISGKKYAVFYKSKKQYPKEMQENIFRYCTRDSDPVLYYTTGIITLKMDGTESALRALISGIVSRHPLDYIAKWEEFYLFRVKNMNNPLDPMKIAVALHNEHIRGVLSVDADLSLTRRAL